MADPDVLRDQRLASASFESLLRGLLLALVVVPFAGFVAATFGLARWQLDVGSLVIRTLEAAGIVSNVKRLGRPAPSAISARHSPAGIGLEAKPGPEVLEDQLPSIM